MGVETGNCLDAVQLKRRYGNVQSVRMWRLGGETHLLRMWPSSRLSIWPLLWKVGICLPCVDVATEDEDGSVVMLT